MVAVERKVRVSVASQGNGRGYRVLCSSLSSRRPLLSVQSPIAWKEVHLPFSSLSSESHPDTFLTPTLDRCRPQFESHLRLD